MNEIIRPGFLWTVESWWRGRLIDSITQHNLMPTQALDYLQNVLFAGGSVPANWYIALYEGDYVPQPIDTAATLPASATECLTYDETTRVAYVPSATVSGATNNYASPADFTSNADKTIYGGMVMSASGKGSVSGTCLSAVRFSVPRSFDDELVLRVKCGFAFASL